MLIYKTKTSLIRCLFSLFLLSMLSACNFLGNETTVTIGDVAIDKITAYAENQNNPAPTIQDYEDAGVSGVTSENLTELNVIVANLELTDVDTTAEIVALTEELNITIGLRAKWDGFKWSDGSVWQ